MTHPANYKRRQISNIRLEMLADVSGAVIWRQQWSGWQWRPEVAASGVGVAAWT